MPERAQGNSVPDSVIEAAAQVVSHQLLRLAEGRADDPGTWLRLGRDLGIMFVPTSDAGTGAYYSADLAQSEKWPLPSGWAVVQFDSSKTGRDLAEVLIHELAHDRLYHWSPPQLPRAADIQYYDDDLVSVHHRIARRVQEMILG